MGDFAHCKDCDVVVNMEVDKWSVINDETYCETCQEVAIND